IVGRAERFLDRARVYPANEVELRPGLVIGARRARPAERLLADDRTRRLVVDVVVAGRIAQCGAGLAERSPIAREDSAGQRIRRRAVDEGERLEPGAVVERIGS